MLWVFVYSSSTEEHHLCVQATTKVITPPHSPPHPPFQTHSSSTEEHHLCVQATTKVITPAPPRVCTRATGYLSTCLQLHRSAIEIQFQTPGTDDPRPFLIRCLQWLWGFRNRKKRLKPNINTSNNIIQHRIVSGAQGVHFFPSRFL